MTAANGTDDLTAVCAQGRALHQAGRLEEAMAHYRRVLTRDPEHFEALHLMGIGKIQIGQTDEGAELIARAIAVNPDLPTAHSNLGMALNALGRYDEALAACDRALAIHPDSADAHINRANALSELGRLDEALAGYDRAAALRPNDPSVHYNRGRALAALKRPAEAVAAYDQAIALRPDYAEAFGNRGVVLVQMGEPAAALASFERTVALLPDSAEAHNNRGSALNDLRRSKEALASCERAIALRADYTEAYNNRGIALFDLKRFDEALASYERAIATDADFADAHFNRATCLLMTGDLAQGFEEYRWRWKIANPPGRMPELSCPLWEGESLVGKTLLVHGEQGYGDALQFIRYVRPLAKMAARVVVLVSPVLAELFRSIPGVEVATEVQDGAFDYHVPMMDLPHRFGTTLDGILADVPYLAADPGKVAHWAERLSEGRAKGLKVGLVWAGDSRRHNPNAHAIDRRRSIGLARYAPLAKAKGVRFVSLQKGEPAAETAHPPKGLTLADFTTDLHDFSDTAALVANLDLVITVDTAVAHLAGALGKPVWVLSRYDGCWRWLNGREDSPWYPTLRLFHQKAPGDWGEVVGRVVKALNLVRA